MAGLSTVQPAGNALPNAGMHSTGQDTLLQRVRCAIYAETSILPLVLLRIVFGLLMFVGTLRFMRNGWIDMFYIQPDFHFTYYGFGWVRPLPGFGLYAIYATIAILALAVALGAFYRVSIIAFFVLFTYTELLDKTYYLNHYYFVSLFCFLLCFLPLHRYASLDSWRNPKLASGIVATWCLWAVRLQIGLVYFYAGVAKLKPDWLFHAMPLRIWLAANSDFPILGGLFDTSWFPYLMSWGGALYDLCIPFLLLNRRTRPWAFLAVIGFHVMTGMLFAIGLFPAIMIACSLVFFSAEDFARVQGWLRTLRGGQRSIAVSPATSVGLAKAARPNRQLTSYAVTLLLSIFFLLQLVVPLRHWIYPGNVLWTEEGFRFAWNVMLVEKTGHVTFTVRELGSGRELSVFPSDYLTAQQEKQMSFQPDMILEFAHYLAQKMYEKGWQDVAVYAEAYVSMNGRRSQLLIDPTVDLAKQSNSLWPKAWILPQNPNQ